MSLCVSSLQIGPDGLTAFGEWIYYRADARVDGEIELFRHTVDTLPRTQRR
jgi:hypothetical protein